MLRRPIVALALVVFATMGNAQTNGTCDDPKAGKLSVTGMGVVTVEPDVAKVQLQVSVTRATAKEAREIAAQTTNDVVAAVDAIDGIDGEKDITTENLSVQPNYVWEQNSQRITGYTFTQSMQVKVNNLTNDMLAAVVDAAVKAGGNNLQVNSIQTDLSAEVKRAAMNEARRIAVEDGDATAQILAQAANVSLGALKSLSDMNSAPPPPVYVNTGAEAVADVAAAKTPTPVQVGTTDVTAMVSMEYAILNK